MDRKKLNSLLEFVKEIASLPKNEWFKNQLAETFNSGLSHNIEQKSSLSSTNSTNLEAKVDLIRGYLAVDIENLIDYSEFEEPIREQLFRDCLEMCRFEKGTPNHKKNFGEFCRYAHLQAEEMINFFFTIASGKDISVLNRYLKQELPNYNPKRNPNSIFHINYTAKLYAFRKLISLEKNTLDLLYFLNDFRNELSHRNSSSVGNDDEVLIKFESLGFAESGYVDFKSLSSDQLDILKKGRFIVAKRKEEFFPIYETLEELKSKVLEASKKGTKLEFNSNSLGDLNPNLQKLKDRFE